MLTFLDKYTEQTYALMRIFVGLFFVQHGTVKLLNFPTEFAYELSAMSIAAGVIELVLGLAIAAGLFTRISAFLSSGMCAVGYWMVHGLGWLDGDFSKFYPINNGGELIATFCFVFLFVACRGAGIWSVDSKLGQASAG